MKTELSIKDFSEYLEKINTLIKIGNNMSSKLAEQHRSHGLCSSFELTRQWNVLVNDLKKK
jgi:hypothetical protein